MWSKLLQSFMFPVHFTLVIGSVQITGLQRTIFWLNSFFNFDSRRNKSHMSCIFQKTVKINIIISRFRGNLKVCRGASSPHNQIKIILELDKSSFRQQTDKQYYLWSLKWNDFDQNVHFCATCLSFFSCTLSNMIVYFVNLDLELFLTLTF